jgi:predicted Zn-dependent peptidase
MFAGSKLGRDIAGTENHVLSYKRPDVLAYRDRYYQPGNMHIIVAGAVTKEMESQIREYFSTKPNTKNISKSFGVGSFGPSAKEKRLLVQKKQTDQAQLMLGFPGFPYDHKQNTVASVMNAILGGSMSSRLFIQIRERRGLAYMVRSGAEQFRDTGYLYVRAGLDGKHINKAIEVTAREIEKFKDKGVTKQELKDAKTHLRGSLTLQLEDSSAQANWYAHEVLFHKRVQTPEEWLDEIDQVDHDDIVALARRVYDFDNMRVAIIGNVDEEKVQF